MAALAGLMGVASVACLRTQGDHDPGPRFERGTALAVGNRFGVKAPFAVGQEIVDLFGVIENNSSKPIELIDIRPRLGDGVPEVGEVLDVFLIERPFLLTIHNALPPVARRNGRCVTAEISPVEGYVLDPQKEVAVGMHLRAVAPGTFRTVGRDVLYTQAGRTFRQTDPYDFTGKVRLDWKRDLTVAERRCRAHTEVLPGG